MQESFDIILECYYFIIDKIVIDLTTQHVFCLE